MRWVPEPVYVTQSVKRRRGRRTVYVGQLVDKVQHHASAAHCSRHSLVQGESTLRPKNNLTSILFFCSDIELEISRLVSARQAHRSTK